MPCLVEDDSPWKHEMFVLMPSPLNSNFRYRQVNMSCWRSAILDVALMPRPPPTCSNPFPLLRSKEREQVSDYRPCTESSSRVMAQLRFEVSQVMDPLLRSTYLGLRAL